MKSNVVWGGIFLIMISVNIYSFKQKESEKLSIALKSTIEKKEIIDLYEKRDILQFQLHSNISDPLIKKIDNLLDSNGIKGDEFLILFMPPNACWNCLVLHLKKIIETADEFHLKLVLLSHKQHFRNLKIYTSQIGSDVNTLSFDDPILGMLDQNLLFIAYEQKAQRIIPYIEIKGFETIELLISNYYEIKN